MASGESFLDDQASPEEVCGLVAPFANQFTGVVTTPEGGQACEFGDATLVDGMLAQQGATAAGPALFEVNGEWHLMTRIETASAIVRYEITLDSLRPGGLLAERDDLVVVLVAGDRLAGVWPDAKGSLGESLRDTSLPPDLLTGRSTGSDLTGVKRIFASVPILDDSWHVAVGLDEAVVTDALATARRDAAVRVALGAAILLALIFFVSRSIVRPIQSLAGRLRTTPGDELPVLPVRGPTEVRELATRFNELSQDVAESTSQLSYLAHHDSLTQLYNRVRISIELEKAMLSATEAEPVTAIQIDLSEFGGVNQSYGSVVGDRVLTELGRRFRSMAEDGLVVGHLGGDEFVFIGQMRSEAVGKTVDRLLATVSQPFVVDGINVECTAVAGATIALPGAEVSQILAETAIALEQAKAGNESLVVFDEEIRARSIERAGLANDLRDALRTVGIDVAFQAIVSYSDGSVTSVEALARWRHPTRGQVSPVDFIPVAERNGLIGELGTAVLRRACTVAAGWHRDHPGIAPCVSVNVSAYQLASRELPELVASVLRDTGLPATALILEVTESALISDLATMSDRLALIRGLGVRVALDDFGTGYSSMSYLAKLPVDSMKIDRSFLTGIEQDERARAIVASVIELAHATGLRVVCEGIETPNEDEIIKGLGADMVQGFLYHRPDQEVDAVLELILDRAEHSITNVAAG